MQADKIPQIADDAAELAMLEAVCPLVANPLIGLLFQRLMIKKIMLPLALDDFLRKNPEVQSDVLINQAMIAAGVPLGVLADEPTKVYFAVFLAVWTALQGFVPPVVAVPANDAPKPDGSGQKMLEKSARGFRTSMRKG